MTDDPHFRASNQMQGLTDGLWVPPADLRQVDCWWVRDDGAGRFRLCWWQPDGTGSATLLSIDPYRRVALLTQDLEWIGLGEPQVDYAEEPIAPAAVVSAGRAWLEIKVFSRSAAAATA
jgi:hypothetical protein